MRQLVHIFYTMGFLWWGSLGKTENQHEKTFELRDFNKRMWKGEINLVDSETKTAFGRVHWEQLLQNVRQARFNEALRIVSERHSRSINTKEGSARTARPAC